MPSPKGAVKMVLDRKLLAAASIPCIDTEVVGRPAGSHYTALQSEVLIGVLVDGSRIIGTDGTMLTIANDPDRKHAKAKLGKMAYGHSSLPMTREVRLRLWRSKADTISVILKPELVVWLFDVEEHPIEVSQVPSETPYPNYQQTLRNTLGKCEDYYRRASHPSVSMGAVNLKRVIQTSEILFGKSKKSMFDMYGFSSPTQGFFVRYLPAFGTVNIHPNIFSIIMGLYFSDKEINQSSLHKARKLTDILPSFILKKSE